MKKILPILSILFVLSVSFIFYPWCSIALADSKHSIKKLVNRIATIQKYQVKLNTKIFPPNKSDLDPNAPDEFDPNRFMSVKSVVFGESGKKMKLITIMKSPELGSGVELTLVCDGTWLWIQKKVLINPQTKTTQPMISAIKIHIPSVSPDPVNEPFNASYGISGTGVFPDKDLPGTFMELIKNYAFEAATKSLDSNKVIFSGIRKNKISSELDITDKELSKFMDKNTYFCRLWVSEKNDRILAYSIGKSENRPTMKTEIEYIKVNKELPDNIFSYVPPEGVNVRDITEKVLKYKDSHK